ncbi:MAG: sugar-binding domain-containing protein [Clostridia bacterium]|nr:sugar-binding domain-containing protein [Clostridia bacterium]
MDGKRLDLLVRVANWYYRDNLTQQEIAKRLFVSRPTVSRLLRACAEEGVVTIRIKDATTKREALAERLRERFGLRRLIIVPSDENLEVTKDRVGSAAAELMAEILHKDELIGISWGTTVNRLLFHMEEHEYPRANVIQILGDTQTNRESNATRMTLSLAEALGGDGYIMQAPMLVGSSLLKELLMQEPHMIKLAGLYDQIRIAILGFGGISAQNHVYLTNGNKVRELYEEVKKHGAVCDLLGSFLNAEGEPVYTPLQELTFAMPLEKLRGIERVIGMAAGVKKSRQLLSALKGGFFDTLIIDEALAESIPPEA